MDNKDILIISQVFPPDPASVGQYLFDFATEMAKRGFQIGVLTSQEGYDEPLDKYPERETIGNIEIIRIKNTSFGKKNNFSRLKGHILFCLKTLYFICFKLHFRSVLITTVPPISSLIGLFLVLFSRKPLFYWVMDINPDQIVALGLAKENSTIVKIFDSVNGFVLSRAKIIITLDNNMKATLERKSNKTINIFVIPPWAHDNVLFIEKKNNNIEYIKQLSLENRFIVMYSGNHSPSNPLNTLLKIVEEMKEDNSVVFLFVGGGTEKSKVEDLQKRGFSNVLSLPYQSFERLDELLATADLHVAIIGEKMVGIVHPSKIYSALGAGRPILTIGPNESHLAQIVKEHKVGFNILHGEVNKGCQIVRFFSSLSPEEMRQYQKRALDTIQSCFSRKFLCGQLCELVSLNIQETRKSSLE